MNLALLSIPDTYTEKAATHLSFVDGKDAALKCIQEAARCCAFYLSKKNAVVKRLSSLSVSIADGRKILRLGKFIAEYVKLRKMSLTADFPSFVKYTVVISAYVANVCESLAYFSKIRIVDRDAIHLTKSMNNALLMQTMGNIYLEVQVCRSLITEESTLKYSLEKASTDKTMEDLKDIQHKKMKSMLQLMRFSMDAMTLCNALGIWKRRFGVSLSDGLAAFLGSVSASIATYQFYQLKAK